jgi:gamma-glutamylcyclotransferase (GGCT)/AIG2-like uncharacterized protein YtfP
MEYIFVYGMFRDSARDLLGEKTFCGKSTIRGKLYRVDNFYPGFVSGVDGKVVGDVYLIDPIVFEKLDEFEGDEYTRKKVRTSTDLDCWVYEYKYDVSGFKEIKSGDWMLR